MMLMTSTTSAPGSASRSGAAWLTPFPAKYPSGIKTRSHTIAPIPLKSVNVQNEMPLEAEYKIIATRLP